MKYLAFLIWFLISVGCNSPQQDHAGKMPSVDSVVSEQGTDTDSKAISPDSGQLNANIRFDTFSVAQSLIAKRFPKEEVFQIIKGDIDLDKKEDLVVITESPCGPEDVEGIDGAGCRIVFFLVANGGSSYTIKALNKEIVKCSQCRSGLNNTDAYIGCTIEDGDIIFEEEFGACEREVFISTYRFDLKRKDWFMIEEVMEQYKCNEPSERFARNVKTGKQLGDVSFSTN